jgi:23S rRNA pseudouridine1911/1915/1917 synthase
MAAEDVRLNILYEDDHLLALDKPAGVVVHPSYKNVAGTVLNALLWRARGWPPGQRPSLVGRLDKGTSGILVVAKTAAIHAALQRTMAASDSEKDYLVVVYGRVKALRGEIRLGLGHDPMDRRKMIASSTAGAPSLTQFERLDSVAAPREGLSLLRCRLVTGRTHQIRVHLSARHWPAVGDTVYGEPRWRTVVDPTLADALRAFPRQALHAWRVAFTHPVSGRRVLIEAPLPRDFEGLLVSAGLSPGRHQWPRLSSPLSISSS